MKLTNYNNFMFSMKLNAENWAKCEFILGINVVL